MKKILTAIVLVIVVLASLLSIYFAYYSHKTIPQLSGKIQVGEQLRDEVIITTDHNGVPHIQAQNQEDLYYALGFTMARERLFQMEMLRRIGSGRLAEILGPSLVETDKFLRTLQLKNRMERFWLKNKDTMDPIMMKLVNRFYKGLNDFAKTNPLPPEFFILGINKIEPFTVVDAMAISGYMALSFAEGMIGDILFHNLEKKFGTKAVNQLREGALGEKIKTPNLKTDAIYSVNWNKYLNPLDTLEKYFGLFHGSNSFALSPQRSKSGMPMLSNDPHIAFSSPGTWFEAHLKSPQFEIYGHFLPLVPFAILGHNQSKAWGITMAEFDDLDFFQEIVEGNDVIIADKKYPIKSYEEVIKVRFGSDQKLIVKETPHGPIMNNTMMVDPENKMPPLALAWSFYHPDNNILKSFYLLNYAENSTQFREALSYAAAPGLNITWIDKSGDIAWQVMGKIPLRDTSINSDIIQLGADKKSQYLGYVDYKNNPHAKNPESGVIVSTNYIPPFQAKYPLDGYWQPSERYLRLNELISKRGKWTAQDLKKIMTDENTVSHRKVLNYLIPLLHQNAKYSHWGTRLQAWDGSSHKESIESSIYHLWSYWMMFETFHDELKDDYEAFARIADYWHTFKNHIHVENSVWWDNIDTKTKESRKDIILKAFENTIAELTSKFGEDSKNWKWGNLHTITYQHPLAKIPLLGKVFNIGPIPSGGGFFQVNNMSSPRADKDFNVTLGPSTRRIIDLKNTQVTFGVLPTGNSGHFKSPFYQNQKDLFINNQFREQYLDISLVKTKSHWDLILHP